MNYYNENEYSMYIYLSNYFKNCPDRSSVMDSQADLRHRAPVLGNGRGLREVGPRHIPGNQSVFEVATLSLMLEIDIRPR